MKLIPVENWSGIVQSPVVTSLYRKSTSVFKLGAIICDKKGRIVATGYNDSKRTHPVFGVGNYKFLHAETSCLYQATRLGIDVKGMTMMVFREGNNLAKPCLGCQKILKQFGIARVYYSTKNGS